MNNFFFASQGANLSNLWRHAEKFALRFSMAADEDSKDGTYTTNFHGLKRTWQKAKIPAGERMW